jgi:hypothetical protein
MSKKKEVNKVEVENRKTTVANCPQCKGSPPIRHCVLQGLHFDVCDYDNCDTIVGDYYKEGAPITVKRTMKSHVKMNDPNFSPNQEITVETTPGKQGFSNLEII